MVIMSWHVYNLNAFRRMKAERFTVFRIEMNNLSINRH